VSLNGMTSYCIGPIRTTSVHTGLQFYSSGNCCFYYFHGTHLYLYCGAILLDCRVGTFTGRRRRHVPHQTKSNWVGDLILFRWTFEQPKLLLPNTFPGTEMMKILYMENAFAVGTPPWALLGELTVQGLDW